MKDPTTWYLGALVALLLLSLILNKLGQIFVELVRIRHELEDANKMVRPKLTGEPPPSKPHPNVPNWSRR